MHGPMSYCVVYAMDSSSALKIPGQASDPHDRGPGLLVAGELRGRHHTEHSHSTYTTCQVGVVHYSTHRPTKAARAKNSRLLWMPFLDLAKESHLDSDVEHAVRVLWLN